MSAHRIPREQMAYLLEWVLALAVVGTLIMNFVKLWLTHAQPQPFIFNINDVYADWFNTAQYSHLYGAYDVWGSIYPPISFAFLNIFSRNACYLAPGMGTIRDCDWVGRVSIFVFFFLCIWMAWRAFRNMDPRTALPRTIAFGCGLPLWYGLERGQLLLVAFPFMVLAHGPYRFRSAHVRWIASAIAINFKPYMLLGVLADIARRRWLATEAVALWIVAIYALTWLYMGMGDPLIVYENITRFSTSFQGGGWGEIYYATTYNSLIKMLEVNPLVRLFLGASVADKGAFWLTIYVRAGQAVILITLLAAWFRPAIATRYRLAGLTLSLAALSTISGGYAMIIICYFAFLEPMRGPARTIVVVASYILCLQADIVLNEISTVYQESYFFGGYAQQTYGVGWGALLRPAIVLLIQLCICASTLQRFFDERMRAPRLNAIARPPIRLETYR